MAEAKARSEAQEEDEDEEKAGAGGGGEAAAGKAKAESSAPSDHGPDDSSTAKGGDLEAPEGSNSAGETATAAAAAKGPAGDGRTFSQLLAGAMASPVGSPRAGAAGPILAVPVDAVRLPVVAVPCFLAPASLLESQGFTGQFAMTHQAVLATVTAQAQMQLQTYPSSSELLSNSLQQPVSLQQKSPMISEENVCKAETEQPPSSDNKSQSANVVVKTSPGDGYNWRKYGQKQVKSSESSRSYYKCTNTNCFAKKKVERCPDGRVVEIIYRGRHNHVPPQKTRCTKERGPLSSGPSGEVENLELPNSEVIESDPSPCKTEQNFGNETPEQQLYCSSDCEVDAGIKTEEDIIEEPDPKRRLSESTSTYSPVLKTIREPKIVVQTACDVGHVSDGYRWRKYGQKIVKGNPNPRSYYRCTHNGCPVRKHVEKASDDAKAIVITYEGKHNHVQPAPKHGMDPSATYLHTTTSARAVKDPKLNTPKSLLQQKPSKEILPDVGEELTGEKASELGGEKALESAQALLSIGFNSPSGEDAGKTNSEAVKNPLFKESTAAVPVQNS